MIAGRTRPDRGTMMGIDYGARRIGIAAADRLTRFARPVEVIDATERDPIVRIRELVQELAVDLIIVGRPVGLSGNAGPAVAAQQEFLKRLRASTPIEITEQDERFTSVEAERGLRGAGMRSQARRERRDAVAAQLLLQAYLDSNQ